VIFFHFIVCVKICIPLSPPFHSLADCIFAQIHSQIDDPLRSLPVPDLPASPDSRRFDSCPPVPVAVWRISASTSLPGCYFLVPPPGCLPARLWTRYHHHHHAAPRPGMVCECEFSPAASLTCSLLQRHLFPDRWTPFPLPLDYLLTCCVILVCTEPHLLSNVINKRLLCCAVMGSSTRLLQCVRSVIW